MTKLIPSIKAASACLLLGLSLPIGLTALHQPAQAMQAQAYLSPNQYHQAATGITTAIDRYEMARVWSSASPVMKASITEEQFISGTAQKRAQLGSIANRDWTSVMRVPISQQQGGLPAGQYVSVRFATTGTNGRTLEEVISFRLDDDNQWRLVGYALN